MWNKHEKVLCDVLFWSLILKNWSFVRKKQIWFYYVNMEKLNQRNIVLREDSDIESFIEQVLNKCNLKVINKFNGYTNEAVNNKSERIGIYLTSKGTSP